MKDITVMNENMTALVILLSRSSIPFKICGTPKVKCTGINAIEYFTQFNIKVEVNNRCVFDIASSSYTYGGDDGLLEIMRFDDKLFDETCDVIIGYLNANKAFEIIKKELNKDTEV